MAWERDQTERGGGNNAASSGGGGERGTRDFKRAPRMTAGFHHLAIATGDLKETVRFYEEALGMKLRAIFPLHGIKGGKHAFLEAGNGNEISFMQFSEPRAGTPGESFAANEEGECPVAVQHHMAYRATSLEHLRALREQVKRALRDGNFVCAHVSEPPHSLVSPIIDHGFCFSCYFRDPTTGMYLELCTTIRGYTEGEEYDATLLDRSPADMESPALKFVPRSKL